MPVLIAILLIILLLPFPAGAKRVSLRDAFSPDQGATDLVVRTIGEARRTIRVAAYSFTSRPIAAALADAEARGVDVRAVLDKSQRKAHARVGPYLKAHGVAVRFNDRFAIMHDKFMIIDGKALELGSFNYTKAAEEKNAENVLVVHNSRRVVRDYEGQWEGLWDGGSDD
jgi:phosphatidylserine/phosphatidylglycerophosphate/cardiolipin synthase-like enzyme